MNKDVSDKLTAVMELFINAPSDDTLVIDKWLGELIFRAQVCRDAIDDEWAEARAAMQPPRRSLVQPTTLEDLA